MYGREPTATNECGLLFQPIERANTSYTSSTVSVELRITGNNIKDFMGLDPIINRIAKQYYYKNATLTDQQGISKYSSATAYMAK